MACVIRLAICLWFLPLAGCYAPLVSPGIPACSLPDSFRVPEKAFSTDLNFAMLTRPMPSDFYLGANDFIRVEIADLVPSGKRLPQTNGTRRVENGTQRVEQAPFSYVAEIRIDDRGHVMLPLIGSVRLADTTLSEARQRVMDAYRKGFLDKPRVSISLIQSSTTRVMVLGHVAKPAVYELPKYESDVAHAITEAGGLLHDEADEIQIHRRADPNPPQHWGHSNPPLEDWDPERKLSVLRIPLRSSSPVAVRPDQVILSDGDVVVVGSRPDEIFFVVGQLSTNNLVRFTLGRENRDLGTGFVLPKDRDVDAVTAVAMAGYIDPIDSPTTVTVHRTLPDGNPLLIHVDLIAARTDRRETVMIQAGDIIYLNPDGAWWFRRTLDRVLPSLLTAPYGEFMGRLIYPRI